MARSRLCRACGDFHNLAEPWPLACASHFGQQGESAGYYIISDTIAPFESMASGRTHDSKSAYRRELKSMGLLELGSDRVNATKSVRPPVGPDIKRAIEELRSR